MSVSQEQTAVDKTDAETETKVTSGTEDSVNAHGKDNDLDALLSEFEGATGSKQTPEPVTAKATQKSDTPNVKIGDLVNKVEKIVERDEAREEAERKRQFDADVGEAVKVVRGDMPADTASDRLIRAWLDALAEDDPRLRSAWVSRKENPAGFKKVLETLSREFRKEFARKPDQNITEDTEIVAAAVKGASTKAPEEKPPNFSQMNNNEFAKEVRSKYGFDPLV